MQAPPKPAKVKIEGVQAVALTNTVTAMRGICNERLKVDVEYNLKRGTTDNSYLIKVLAFGLGTSALYLPCSAERHGRNQDYSDRPGCQEDVVCCTCLSMLAIYDFPQVILLCMCRMAMHSF